MIQSDAQTRHISTSPRSRSVPSVADRVIAELASVNFLRAKEMLEKKEVCILKAKAPKIKEGIDKLKWHK